jgi:catechol 2,3-dioxygenase
MAIPGDRFVISDDAKIDRVAIVITDLPRSLKFYQEIVGLDEIARGDDWADLGAGGKILLHLTENKHAIPIGMTAGLYHFALLTPSRFHLARSLKQILDTKTPVDGFANHTVSESIYLPDPDGIIVEIYADRPKSEWHDARGNFRITVDPLNLDSVLAELGGAAPDWTGLAPETIMGHIHVYVSYLEPSKEFYMNVLGFRHIADYMGSASFVAADGYHHHVGMNVWRGVGVPPAPKGSVGLDYYVIAIPDPVNFSSLSDHIQSQLPRAAIGPNSIILKDMGGNAVVVELRK